MTAKERYMSKGDKFFLAYVECALWSSLDDKEVPLDKNYDKGDLSQPAREKMEADCTEFMSKSTATVSAYPNRDGLWDEWEHAGHDFWLTRNGHGAGFWDGDWEKSAGEYLTKLAKTFGECHLYVGDDGKLYL